MNMSWSMTKPTKWPVLPAKTQISLGIRPVWSEPSLYAQCVAKILSFLHADNEDSDQTGWMSMLIWVFAGRTGHFDGLVVRRLICFLTDYVSVCIKEFDKLCMYTDRQKLPVSEFNGNFYMFSCTL